MSDAWEEIQAVQRKRNSLRERLEKRKKERACILGSNLASSVKTEPIISSAIPVANEEVKIKNETKSEEALIKIDPELERELLKSLADVTLQLPISSSDLVDIIRTTLKTNGSHKQVCNLLQKFATQKLIMVKDSVKDSISTLDVVSVEVTKVNAMIAEFINDPAAKNVVKRKREDTDAMLDDEEEDKKKKEKKEPKTDIFVSILSTLL